MRGLDAVRIRNHLGREMRTVAFRISFAGKYCLRRQCKTEKWLRDLGFGFCGFRIRAWLLSYGLLQ